MRKPALIAALSAFALTASPALADIAIFSSPGALQPTENVLFQSDDPMGSTAFGLTNQTATEVTFVGMENLLTPSSGQARVEAVDGGLSDLQFFLTDMALVPRSSSTFSVRDVRRLRLSST